MKLTQKMQLNRKIKRCDVCTQDIHRYLFAQYIPSNNRLLKAGEKVRSETCYLVFSSGHDFENHVRSENHIARQKGLEMRCETCIRETTETVCENHSSCQIKLTSKVSTK